MSKDKRTKAELKLSLEATQEKGIHLRDELTGSREAYSAMRHVLEEKVNKLEELLSEAHADRNREWELRKEFAGRLENMEIQLRGLGEKYAAEMEGRKSARIDAKRWMDLAKEYGEVVHDVNARIATTCSMLAGLENIIQSPTYQKVLSVRMYLKGADVKQLMDAICDLNPE